jgi:non-specific serine/threonine protein kinase
MNSLGLIWMRDLIGRTVGHYQIVEHLGGGGMGVVYKAEDTRLGRTVALKFLPAEWSRDPDARERFLREARAASALEDSRICTIHDIDETDDGRLFIAMAFYDGETLKKRLQRGQLSTDEAVDIAVQVAEGLKRAHVAGIIHRDIKPANLILTADGEVKIVDFGLAKLAGEHDLTKTGATVGTPHYMSPEQAKGTGVGPTTDVWSLGVVLYEMVTGQRPFAGDSGDAVVHSILREEPSRLGEFRTDTSPMLERIVQKALSKDQTKRYSSVEEILGDLRTLQAASVESGLRTAAMEAPAKKHRRLIAGLGLGIIIVLTVVLTWVLSRQTRAPVAPDETPRIVVLPFENLGPPEDEYFADGVSEEITSRLAAVSGLQVISRSSAMYYKGRHLPVRQIGRELGVGYVLEGTIRWDRGGDDQDRVRVTPQLIRVADDSHLWSERYDRVLEDIFAVQSEIAERVISQLQATLLEPERRVIESQPTENLEAYQAYLLGLELASDLNVIENYEAAISSFERAVSLDPGFVSAWAELSFRNALLYRFQETHPERKQAAWTAAQRAVDLGPDQPDGHIAMGRYFVNCERDQRRALTELERALEIRPNDSTARRVKVWAMRRLGQFEESTRLLEEIITVDPRDPLLYYELGGTYMFLREFQSAAQAFERSIALAPERVDGYIGKWEMLLRQGMLAEAREVLETVPSTGAWVRMNWIQQELAERRFDKALERIAETPEADYEALFGTAAMKSLDECKILTLVGETERASASCEAACAGLEDLVERYPANARARSQLSFAFSALGLRDEAIREIDRSVAILPVSRDAMDGPQLVWDLAWTYSWFGEYDVAFDRLEYVLSIHSKTTTQELGLHPLWDHVRDHPRFEALIEKYDVD